MSWWHERIKGQWVPTSWESSPGGTELTLRDFGSAVLGASYVGANLKPRPLLASVIVIVTPTSRWRRFLLRLAGVL